MTHKRIALWAALLVYIPTAALAMTGVWLLGPTIEERFWPIIDPTRDYVENMHVIGDDFCWDSRFFKLRPGDPVSVTRQLKIVGKDATAATYIDAYARRVVNAKNTTQPFLPLKLGEQRIGWCMALPTAEFRSLELTSEWAYRSHRFWLTPQHRASVTYYRDPG